MILFYYLIVEIDRSQVQVALTMLTNEPNLELKAHALFYLGFGLHKNFRVNATDLPLDVSVLIYSFSHQLFLNSRIYQYA